MCKRVEEHQSIKRLHPTATNSHFRPMQSYYLTTSNFRSSALVAFPTASYFCPQLNTGRLTLKVTGAGAQRREPTSNAGGRPVDWLVRPLAHRKIMIQ